MQLTSELQGKRLRIEFSDGEIAAIKVLVVSQCSGHEDCGGFVYDVISTNRPDRLREGSASWADYKHIEIFEIVGD